MSKTVHITQKDYSYEVVEHIAGGVRVKQTMSKSAAHKYMIELSQAGYTCVEHKGNKKIYEKR